MPENLKTTGGKMVTNDLSDVLMYRVRSKLEKIGKNKPNLRKAYCSGVYWSLMLALAYEEKGRPEVGLSLWTYLTKTKEPTPSVKELIMQINWLSWGEIQIDEVLIPNKGLRYGQPGKFYAEGTADTLELCVFGVPQFIRRSQRGMAYQKVSDWIQSQMEFLAPEL